MNHVKLGEVVDASARLNAFANVAAFLDSAVFPGGSESAYRTCERIRKLCRTEQIRQLKLYDKAVNALNKEKP